MHTGTIIRQSTLLTMTHLLASAASLKYLISNTYHTNIRCYRKSNITRQTEQNNALQDEQEEGTSGSGTRLAQCRFISYARGDGI